MINPVLFSFTETMSSSMLLPLQLSPQGMVVAHASMILKRGIMPDQQDKVMTPYYTPAFWCTARAIGLGPGDTALCIFPHDEPVVSHDNEEELGGVWCLKLSLRKNSQPFVFPRHTSLEAILTYPQVTGRLVTVPCTVLQQLRKNYKTFLTPPVTNILCPLATGGNPC